MKKLLSLFTCLLLLSAIGMAQDKKALKSKVPSGSKVFIAPIKGIYILFWPQKFSSRSCLSSW